MLQNRKNSQNFIFSVIFQVEASTFYCLLIMFRKPNLHKILNTYLKLTVNLNGKIAKNSTNYFQRKAFLGNAIRTFSSFKSRANFDDYEKAKKEFVYTLPEKFNFASDVLDIWAIKESNSERTSEVPAFWFVYENGTHVKWNYRELSEKSKKAANVLETQCGLKKGDPVMILLPKIPEFWLFNIAAMRTGVVLSPCSMQLRESDIKYRLEALKPKCIIAADTMADIVDKAEIGCLPIEKKVLVSSRGKEKDGWLNFQQLYHEASTEHQCIPTDSNDPMMIFFTSGTTGFPKMVEHTQASYGIGHFTTGKCAMDLTEHDVMWNLSDTGWAKTAYGCIFGPWSMGACVFIHEMPKYSSSLVVEMLKNNFITTFCAPATVYRLLLYEEKSNLNFEHLAHCISGGEAVPPELIHAWEKTTGLRIYVGYGQTETTLLLGVSKCIEYRRGSIGKPLPGMNVVIIDDKENELGANELGEIAIKLKPLPPVGLLKHYRNNPEKTNEQMTENYYKTGDLAHYDEDGFFWFKSRNDDIINSAGYRIGPSEVEEVLLKHPAVVDAAVVSSPDEDRGEVVKAFVILSEKFSDCDKDKLTEELQSFVKTTTAPYKYPRKIEFVKAFPRTDSGKVKRFELRNKEWGRK